MYFWAGSYLFLTSGAKKNGLQIVPYKIPTQRTQENISLMISLSTSASKLI